MLHYYKHLFTSFLSAWFAQNGPDWVSAVTETSEAKQLPELSVKEILDTISADNKLDGNDKAAVDELKTRFESDKGEIESETRNGIKESLNIMLEDGYTVENQNDYDVLKKILFLEWNLVELPEYDSLPKVQKISFANASQEWYLYVYDASEGKYGEKIWFITQGVFSETKSIHKDMLHNNNKVDFSGVNFAEENKQSASEPTNYVEKRSAEEESKKNSLFNELSDFDITNKEDITIPFRADEDITSTESLNNQENTKDTVETNELTKTQKLEASILSVKEKYPAVDIKIQDGKCNIAYENGYYTTYFTIDSPSNEKYLSKEGLLWLVENKLDKWGGYKASNEAKKDSEDKSESDKDFTETVTDTIQDIKEGALETYDDVVAWLREYFKNAPDAGTIDLGNGETLEVEYDDLNNKLYVDTQFFDGIYDYKSEIDLWDLSGKNPDELKELIASKNADFLQEYTDKVEAAEAEKMKKWMVDVLKGEKSRKTIDTLTINQEEMNVILFRDRKGDVKAKLSTPYGDGVSDSDLTIKLASIWDKISLNEIRNKIAQENFEKKYMELYKKNNPEKKAA